MRRFIGIGAGFGKAAKPALALKIEPYSDIQRGFRSRSLVLDA
jgi:hypothetical protein